MRIRRMADLSQDIYHNCPVAPAFAPPRVELLRIGARDGWTVEQVTMNLHTATHIDAPAHLDPFRTTLDLMPVDRFHGELVLVELENLADCDAPAPILPEHLEKYKSLLGPDSIVLFYTGWGEKRGWTKEWLYESPYVCEQTASLLAEQGVRGVGIDHYSIGGTGPWNEATHRKLLAAGIWIAEGLQLSEPALRDGHWHIMALPVKFQGASGAPARVVAIQYEEG
jgi:arylformamidase